MINQGKSGRETVRVPALVRELRLAPRRVTILSGKCFRITRPVDPVVDPG